MRIQKTIILFLVGTLFLTCKNNNQETKARAAFITVNLEPKGKNNRVVTTTTSISFFDSIPEEFKGIANRDSAMVGFLNTIYSKDLETLADEDKNIQTKVYCLSGHNNGKQFYIIDINGNKDFSDDKIVEFDKELTYKTENDSIVKAFFPAIKLKVDKIENGIPYQDEVHVNIYPQANYFSSENETKTERFLNSLQLLFKFQDYLDGNFLIKNTNYNIFLNKYGWNGYELYFSHDELPITDKANKLKGTYELNDTIKLSDFYYKIEEVTLNPPLIKLHPISIEKEIFSFREGYKMKNFEVENLEGHKSTIMELFNGKKLLLIDFWGTWCGPCKELTPDLIDLNNNFLEKVSVVSLAYEQDPTPVEAYVKANKMSWYNGIIKGVPKSANPKAQMIKELRIMSFPTFILLSENHEILYRGSGDVLQELSSIIRSY